MDQRSRKIRSTSSKTKNKTLLKKNTYTQSDVQCCNKGGNVCAYSERSIMQAFWIWFCSELLFLFVIAPRLVALMI
jgi:hypothetical protein